jgi:integrase
LAFLVNLSYLNFHITTVLLPFIAEDFFAILINRIKFMCPIPLTPIGAAQAASFTPAEIESEIRVFASSKGLHPRTTAVYLDWHYRFLVFHGRRHPAEMGAAEVGAFLSYLSSERKVAASSLHQARFALTFVYEKVLGISLERLRFRQLDAPDRVPRVCTSVALAAVLDAVAPEWQLPARLLYACGLRLHECLQLRVRDCELGLQRLAIRLPDGKLDRHVPLPLSLLPDLVAQCQAAEAAIVAASDLPGFLGAPKRKDLAEQLPDAGFLFPAQHTAQVQRHLSESGLQKAVKAAFAAAAPGIKGSCSTLRHSFGAHQLAVGQPIATVQAWLGQKGLRYTRKYLDQVG